MQELLPINILIGDRTYRVRIDHQDEEIVRRTLKTINDKIMEFKSQYSGKDMQDYVAMVLLWFSTQSAGIQAAADPGKEILSVLDRMEEQLDKVL